MYDRGVAEVYDQIYAAIGKDYAAEAEAIAQLVRQLRPEAAGLLDVACGTGEHLRHFRPWFADVAGVELAEPMRRIAREKLPEVPIHAGDMRTFDLSRTYDAVVCLFSAIGYMRDLDELGAAVRRMAAHLCPGGVLIVEPWFTPDQYHVGRVSYLVDERDGRTVMRMAYSGGSGRLSVMDMHYLVGRAGGVRHWTETHEMGLFTVAEYERAFTDAGLSGVELLPGWQAGRDRFVAIRRS